MKSDMRARSLELLKTVALLEQSSDGVAHSAQPLRMQLLTPQELRATLDQQSHSLPLLRPIVARIFDAYSRLVALAATSPESAVPHERERYRVGYPLHDAYNDLQRHIVDFNREIRKTI
jgi:hypothetical protein